MFRFQATRMALAFTEPEFWKIYMHFERANVSESV